MLLKADAARYERPARLGRLLSARPKTAAFVMGALAAAALAPFHMVPALLAFAGLVHLVVNARGARRAFVVGWWFGFGHFLVGLYWIAIAFFTDVERFGALALPAVVLLSAFLAIMPGLAAGIVGLRQWRKPESAGLALAVSWTAGELVRGIGLAFPWNLIGYAWSGFDVMAQSASLVGVYGLSLITVATAALPVGLLTAGHRTILPSGLAAAVLGALALFGVWRLADAPFEQVDGVILRIVQGNVAQHHKWQPELRARWFERHLELSARPGNVSHIIWPESATPFSIEGDEGVRMAIASVTPPGGALLTGGERVLRDKNGLILSNSLFAIDSAGGLEDRYDKSDLVPFGEFLPVRALLESIGLGSVTGGSVDFTPGPGRRTMRAAGLPPFSPLICYEAIFSGRAVDPRDRPQWLLNITNDAWFGISSGPYQHLSMVRLRTVEEGLPLIRAANTGISAVVDSYGRIQARLPLGTMGVLDSPLPQALAQPPLAARLGATMPIMLAIALALLACAIEYGTASSGRRSHG